MAGIYSIFNIGTGHSRIETNNSIANLWRACNGVDLQDKYVNDGPGVHWYDLAGKTAGRGMDPRRRQTVTQVLSMHPNKVNLTDHSRPAGPGILMMSAYRIPRTAEQTANAAIGAAATDARFGELAL